MRAQCGAFECTVTGYIEWQARSLARGATSSGIASFTYVLVPSGGTFLVREETDAAANIRGSIRQLHALLLGLALVFAASIANAVLLRFGSPRRRWP
jgi:hypothetical protein